MTKEARIYNGEKTVSNKQCWENWTATCKRMNTHPNTIHKNNSKWIKKLNVRLNTIKFLEENIGRVFSDINNSKILFDPFPRIIKVKKKVNKWYLVKF